MLISMLYTRVYTAYIYLQCYTMLSTMYMLNLQYDTIPIYTGRIMELLQYKHRHLEQQRIGDMAIIPSKETRANIYSLYR